MTESVSSTWMIEIQIKQYIFATNKQNLETICKKKGKKRQSFE